MATTACSNAPGQDGSLLAEKLSKALPKGYSFGCYHLSTPPTKTNALCSAPPGERDDKTYCESHFLAITIDSKQTTSSRDANENASATADTPLPQVPVPVLAIEILIFTTAHSSTFFVSKADSTGYLALLDLPKGTPSPIREVCGAFMAFLLEHRRRKDMQSVVSLFARAQDQYLFPGSIKNKTKHVLDDRALVKWWCKVLDPLVREPPTGGKRSGGSDNTNNTPWASVKGYVVVPGLDKYESRPFLPRESGSGERWALQEDPLDKISHYTKEFDWVPPRCLIPRYPDDPKSRFRDELDEEADKSKALRTTGMWKSIRSVEQFWDMMAFRQECSSGRLTGFIWVVFDPVDTQRGDGGSGLLLAPDAASAVAEPEPEPEPVPEPPSTPPRKRDPATATTPLITPRKLFPTSLSLDCTPSKQVEPIRNKSKEKRALKGVIKPRQPHVKTHRRNYILKQSPISAYYHWPPEGRGQMVVSESDYKRAVELLLHLDFANIDLATGSTRRWVREVGMSEAWGYHVVGQMEASNGSVAGVGGGGGEAAGDASVNNLSGLVKRKRAASTAGGDGEGPPAAKVLGPGLVRKKPKA